MPLVDLIDETFVVADQATVAKHLLDPVRWQAWWPDLKLTAMLDRGLKGVRWAVSGALVGSAEIWLEPWADGVIVHWYLQADPTRSGSHTEAMTGDSRRLARLGERLRRQYATSWKRHVFAVKDELEANRSPGSRRG